MTSAEALAAFDRTGPLDGQWAAFREHQKQATQTLEQLSGEELRVLVPVLAQRLDASHDTTAQAAFALPLARAALESGEPTSFLERIARASFSNPFIEALIRLDALGDDVWPMARAMLTTGSTWTSPTRA